MRPVTLERGSLLRLEDARGTLIRVREGAIWLTQEGDARDRYLAPGAEFRLDRDGVALAQATRRGTTVTLTPL
jgi:hypothetical protein